MSAPLTNIRTGAQLYGRAYSVTLQGILQNPVWGNEAATQTPLRVTFDIKRTLTDKGNSASVVLYNLSPASRRAFVPGVGLTLRAGYLGNTGGICLGVVAKSKTEQEGPDVKTTVDVTDAVPLANMATMDRSYPNGTTLLQVLRDLAQAMAVNLNDKPVRVVKGIAVGIPPFVYANGFTAEGACGHTLDIVCRPRGLEWSIANGALTIIPKKGYDGRQLQILSKDTGLVNIPGDSGGFVTMVSLLNPRLVPGGLVELQTRTAGLSGTYKARACQYKGDTHGAEWQVEMEGVRYDGTVIPLPAAPL